VKGANKMSTKRKHKPHTRKLYVWLLGMPLCIYSIHIHAMGVGMQFGMHYGMHMILNSKNAYIQNANVKHEAILAGLQWVYE
jgi:hypothetical protein